MNHPNIVKFYGCAKINDDFVIVMTYVDGTNLDSMIIWKEKSGGMSCVISAHA